ncbi:MAG: hypothetical protein K2Q28_16600 [Hyphomicrobium sp.]|nr:hypothetical protein [Hyphomicrobium sp.]
MSSSKIFGVGLQKTGTKSLQIGLGLLGLRCKHGLRINRPPRSITIEPPLTNEKVFIECSKHIKGAEAFCDIPWAMLFREFDDRFPGSKFILTVRDSERWRKSLEKHLNTEKRAGSDIHTWIYGDAAKIGDFERCVEIYEDHNEAVRSHFRGRPDDFLEIDITKEDVWPPLCRFLGLPVPKEEFPHVNATGRINRDARRSTRLQRWISEREIRLKRRFRIAKTSLRRISD